MIRNYSNDVPLELVKEMYKDEFSKDTTDLSGEQHLTVHAALDRIFSIKNTKESDEVQTRILDDYEKYLRNLPEN